MTRKQRQKKKKKNNEDTKTKGNKKISDNWISSRINKINNEEIDENARMQKIDEHEEKGKKQRWNEENRK